MQPNTSRRVPVLSFLSPWYNTGMETKPFSNVADLSATQRQAVESMVGRPLQGEDMVFLVVMRPGHDPSSQDKAHARARLEKIFE
jgi:hypothetical protein